MSRLSPFVLVAAMSCTTSYATIITYDAISGVLPSDLSIPPEERFQEIGPEFGFSSVGNGILSADHRSLDVL